MVENWTPPEYKPNKVPLELICAQQETLILRTMDINYRLRGESRKMLLINQHRDFFILQLLQSAALRQGIF